MMPLSATSFLSRLIVSGVEYALFMRTIPSSSAAPVATGDINTNANSAADRMLRVSMAASFLGLDTVDTDSTLQSREMLPSSGFDSETLYAAIEDRGCKEFGRAPGGGGMRSQEPRFSPNGRSKQRIPISISKGCSSAASLLSCPPRLL